MAVHCFAFCVQSCECNDKRTEGAVKEKEKFPAVGVEYSKYGLMLRERMYNTPRRLLPAADIIIDLEME
jgi:hypothetical protein